VYRAAPVSGARARIHHQIAQSVKRAGTEDDKS
jgi:hypothetical protein